VYSSSGTVIKPAQFVTTQTQGVDYEGPTPVAFQSGVNQRVLLLSFRRDDPENPTYKIVSLVFDSNGLLVSPQADFYSLRGADLDGVQADDGDIVVTWIDLGAERVNYVVLGPDLSKPAGPNLLYNPDDAHGRRAAGRVSVARSLNGRAVLTWMDESFKQRLYYALVNGNGPSGVVTRPIVFRYLQMGVETVLETRAAYGNAEYLSAWRILLPLVRR
jgi:hypothetical protein